MIKVTVSALGTDTEVHRIVADEVTIGRGNTNSVPLHGIGISRQHCRAFIKSGRVYVEDLGSTNGTVVRGVTIESPLCVPPGTPVDVGECRVLFEYGPDDEAEEPMERTVAVQAAPPAPPKPPPSSGAAARVIEEVRAERQENKSTLARSKVARQPVDRRATIGAIRLALDHLILDEAAAQFERELRASSPPADAALALLKRMLTAEARAMDESDE